jgi:DNA-directed RNA polymerase sigma subunit (sigma70/sigma32)
LLYGARRALRLYREAEIEREREQTEVEARHAVRKLLASGDINGSAAKALRLYAGTDNGKWRTYTEVGRIMKMSKEGVRKTLLPSKIALTRVLGIKTPWRPVGDRA